MASNAFVGHLDPLLEDASHLLACADQLSPGIPGRRSRVAALNRSVVITCVSAWEAYIEELARESLNVLRPPAPPLGVWPALNATVRGQLGRFNTPNAENIRMLISDALGLQDVHSHWAWQNCKSEQAVQRLTEAMTLRPFGGWHSVPTAQSGITWWLCTDRQPLAAVSRLRWRRPRSKDEFDRLHRNESQFTDDFRACTCAGSSKQ
jgi:hypothetical protein